MKLSAIFVFIMAVFALFIGQSEAAPKVNVNAIKKGGKIIRKGLGVAGAAGTAHEIYSHVRNRHN
ncbi:moricin-like isoform X2 [Maniola hyperantus]|uniref:moricin-like isoform X2 n=1 Tax=Aphantopus hyperantus TaxID=2795564 RepID=UPI0015690300|nr:moricin-like [Maniola hyperantus]